VLPLRIIMKAGQVNLLAHYNSVRGGSGLELTVRNIQQPDKYTTGAHQYSCTLICCRSHLRKLCRHQGGSGVVISKHIPFTADIDIYGLGTLYNITTRSWSYNSSKTPNIFCTYMENYETYHSQNFVERVCKESLVHHTPRVVNPRIKIQGNSKNTQYPRTSASYSSIVAHGYQYSNKAKSQRNTLMVQKPLLLNKSTFHFRKNRFHIHQSSQVLKLRNPNNRGINPLNLYAASR